MYRLCAFVLPFLLVCSVALADRAVAPAAPIDPPAVEGMMAEAPADEDILPMGELPAELPDYRAAQKPKMPSGVKAPTP